MGVTKTWTFTCDVCKRTVITSGGGLPKGWIRTYRQRLDGIKGEDGIFCSISCACDGLEGAAEEDHRGRSA